MDVTKAPDAPWRLVSRHKGNDRALSHHKWEVETVTIFSYGIRRTINEESIAQTGTWSFLHIPSTSPFSELFWCQCLLSLSGLLESFPPVCRKTPLLWVVFTPKLTCASLRSTDVVRPFLFRSGNRSDTVPVGLQCQTQSCVSTT